MHKSIISVYSCFIKNVVWDRPRREYTASELGSGARIKKSE